MTFLYFYYLLRGSQSRTGQRAHRIAVFDDPVSGLDSDILFVVSSLIKSLIDETQSRDGNIRQVFILTHNVYFHKEVSFQGKRSGNSAMAYETFWIIKKTESGSVLRCYRENPIKNSYELLWAEVRSDTRSSLTIQNTLRRIIENYFTHIGGISRENIISLFNGRDRLLCASLFSWINDGSHYASDDLFVVCDDATIERYIEIFKEIFIRTKHDAHYKMMMGIPPDIRLSSSLTQESGFGGG